MIYWFLLLFWSLITVYYIAKYFKKPLGVFQAPFLFSIAALVMHVPQFSSIILNPSYNNNILYNLTFVMISCFISFSLGWEKAMQKDMKSCYDLNFASSKFIMLLLFFIGLYASYKNSGVWMNTLDSEERTKFIIFVNLSTFLDLSFFYAITYIISKKKITLFTFLIIIISSFFYLNSIFLLARRAVFLKLILALTLMISFIKPKIYSKIKWVILIIFIVGNIASSSISEYRTNLSTKNDLTIDYIENFKNSFNMQDLSVGMDLGNAALAIDYCYKNNTYNFALANWNDFVSLYVPRFLVGEKFKNSLMFDFEHKKYASSLTHGVTTLTGYYDAFSSFGYLGFILFYFLGFLLGRIWVKMRYSKLYFILYLILLPNIPQIASHGVSYIFGKLELFWIFLVPLLITHLYVIYINKSNSHKNEKKDFNINKYTSSI